MLPSDSNSIVLRRNIWIVLACINIGAPVFEILEYRSANVSSVTALVSLALTLLLLNSIAVWKISARLKRGWGVIEYRRPILISGVMTAIALASTGLGISLVKQKDDYAALARSNVPLSNIAPERKRLVVEYIRRVAANSQEEDQAIAQAKKVPLYPPVYSPESFASPVIMRATVAALTRYAQVDFTYSDKLFAVSQDFHRKMAVCDPDYLKSWDADRNGQDQIEKSADQLEHEWLGSVNALYGYGEQNAQEIKIREGTISILDPTVRQRFDDLLSRSKALHQKLENTVQEEVRRQQQAKARTGE